MTSSYDIGVLYNAPVLFHTALTDPVSHFFFYIIEKYADGNHIQEIYVYIFDAIMNIECHALQVTALPRPPRTTDLPALQHRACISASASASVSYCTATDSYIPG